jgi:predicted transcriptional regulator
MQYCLNLKYAVFPLLKRGQLLDYLAPLKSGLKLDIMLSLLDGEKKLAEIKKTVQTRETTILHVLKEFEQLQLTKKSGGMYQLTSLGLLEARVCKGCCLGFEVLKKYKDFWLTHDVSGIPPPLMMKIGALAESTLVKSEGVNLQKVHESFLSLLLSSKCIKGVSPIFHPDYIAAFKQLISGGCRVDLIVTSEVFQKIQTDPQHELLERYVAEGKLGLFLNDSLKFALTVTEKNVSLGLFSLSGEYDYSNDLICSGEEGLEWGKQLFAQTLEKSTKM